MARKDLFKEADLEARVLTTMSQLCPWLDSADFTFQTTFSFKIGRAEISIDGKRAFRAQGRADLIVAHRGSAIAVFELKRPGWAITQDDIDQGLSYAKFLTPQPPLVIVSNGPETRFFFSHDGAEWTATGLSEAKLLEGVRAAMKLAAGDRRDAIRVLMGPSSAIWTQAIRVSSAEALADLTGDLADESKPLVDWFLIERNAASELSKGLDNGVKVQLLAGPPLSGKTSVMRQLVLEHASSDYIVFYLDLHASGASIVRSIAYILEASLSWPASDDDVRQWLIRLSKDVDGCALVLALDGLEPSRTDIQREVEELASPAFGPKLRLIASIDPADERRLTHGADGRTQTRIGRTALITRLEPLTEAEFRRMATTLADRRILFLRGAEKSFEWRHPWIIRAHMATHVDLEVLKDERVALELPPFLSVEILRHALEKFDQIPDVRAAHGRLARALIDHVEQGTPSVNERLESLFNFALSVEIAKKVVSDADLESMRAKGYWRIEYRGSARSMLVPRMRELLAAELAQQLGEGLIERATPEPEAAARWLIRICNNLPLGAVIGAAALIQAGSSDGKLAADLIQVLVATPPLRQSAPVGSRLSMHHPGVGPVQILVKADGKLEFSAKNIPPKEFDGDEDGAAPEMIADLLPWLILSHLAALPMELASKDHENVVRADYQLLLQIGCCPMILRGAEEDTDWLGHYSHNIDGHGEVACPEGGIIEPITLSMRKALARDGAASAAWVDTAIERGPLPLLMRLSSALRSLDASIEETFAEWVRERSRAVSERINLLFKADHTH